MEFNYVLANHYKQYLKRGKLGNYVLVNSIELADHFDSEFQANNVLINNINKNLRDRYFVKEIPLKDIKINNSEELVDECYKYDYNIIEKLKNININKTDIKQLIDIIKELNIFIEQISKKYEILSKDLSDIDCEISDIQHYIEFANLNAYQGWHVCSLLKDKLIKRRDIKDELSIISNLKDCKFDIKDLENIQLFIKNMKNRQYKPKKLFDLFENK